MAIQVKAIEQFFDVIPFIELYKVIFTFKSVDGTLMRIQMKATEHGFHVVLVYYAVQGR